MLLKKVTRSLRRLVGLIAAGGAMDHPANGGMTREQRDDDRDSES
ncbi:hypothetical protein ACFQJ7_16450 [Halovenus rubra]|uniref:Uncharacterized protein n=2 Tax=Halovenus rubra TaxID=869890 RepID=A0ACC7DW11_9EURY|nr:hypothetical protein [Halovenus rubra]